MVYFEHVGAFLGLVRVGAAAAALRAAVVVQRVAVALQLLTVPQCRLPVCVCVYVCIYVCMHVYFVHV
jgi:hypothetical protein